MESNNKSYRAILISGQGQQVTVNHVWICFAQLLDDSADFVKKFVVSNVARQQVRVGKMQVVGGESIEEIRKISLAQNLTFDRFIARVIGELNRVDRVDIKIQQLNRTRKTGSQEVP